MPTTGVPAGSIGNRSSSNARWSRLVETLRRVWTRHFEQDGDGKDGGLRLRPVQGRGPSTKHRFVRGNRVESPYDTEARFRAKAGTTWTGYMVHFTETCDAGAPRLVVHADTAPANVHEAPRTAPIYSALAAKGLAPSEHLVDAAYVSADHLISACKEHGIGRVGPSRRNLSWQARAEDAFSSADFIVDWDRRTARCPEGKQSAGWYEATKRPGQRTLVRAQFRAADCLGCAFRNRCTRSKAHSKGRVLAVLPRPEYEALAARARESTAEGAPLCAASRNRKHPFIGMRAFGLRQTRHRGLAKTGLQHMAIAAAINLDRVLAWFRGRPIAPTRRSRFAALAA